MNLSFVDEKWLDECIFSILNNIPIQDFLENCEKSEEIKNSIQSLVDKAAKSSKSISYNLSIFSSGCVNNVDINVNISKNSDRHLNFYLSGQLLKKYCSRLMHFIVRKNDKVVHYPQNGTNFSKWYPFCGKCIPIMIKMATNLRLLEIYLQSRKREGLFIKSANILGTDISVEIPENYESIPSLRSFLSNGGNPRKVGNGLYIYGVNGVNTVKINKMLRYISCFRVASNKIFPTCVCDFDLAEFVESDFMFAITSWNNHSRFLIKSERIVYIVDPWMKFLCRDLEEKIRSRSEDLEIKFLSRRQRDQEKEGSCVLCCFARMLFTADNIEDFSEDSLRKSVGVELNDFYAYFAFFIYSVTSFRR